MVRRLVSILILVCAAAGCTQAPAPGTSEVSGGDEVVIPVNTAHYAGIKVLTGSVVLQVLYGSQPHPIDVFVVSEASLAAFQAEQGFISQCTDEVAKNGSMSCELDAGIYYMVFDNTEYGHAKPAGDTRVAYSYVAS